MDHLSCVVCKGKAINPRMCPNCTKFSCFLCLYGKCLDFKILCPYCQILEKRDKYIKVSWASEVCDSLEEMRTADNCSFHPKRQLTTYCRDCSKTMCGLCWKPNHESHKIIPLEAAHDHFRTAATDALQNATRLKLRVVNFLTSLTEDLTSYHNRKFAEMRKFSLMQKKLLDSFEKDYSSFTDPLIHLREKVAIQLSSLDNFIGEVKNISRESMLNRLVDRGSELTKGPLDENQLATLSTRIRQYRSPDIKSMKLPTPWIPDWDIVEKVTIENPTHLPSHRSDVFFKRNDVKWTVGVAYSSATFPGSGKAGLTPSRIGLIMEGRSELKNYRFVVENGVPQVDSVSTRATTKLRIAASFPRPFKRGVFLALPLPDPKKWVDEKGGLSFLLMIGPMTYQQKCEDLEIFVRKISGNVRNRADTKKEVKRDEESSSSSFSSFASKRTGNEAASSASENNAKKMKRD